MLVHQFDRFFGAFLAAALVIAAGRAAGQSQVTVFTGAGIQFGGDAGWNSQAGVTRLDSGRVIERILTLPPIDDTSSVTARLNIWAADDHWDRAGSIQLVSPNGTVELHKFITGFGGTTSHQQNVTNLVPYLRQGPVTIRAFVDTWVSQAWKIDFSLQIANQPEVAAPVWNQYLLNDQDWRAGEYANNRRRVIVNVPLGMGAVKLNYLASGHASDGEGGDEFTQRVHKIFIDGVEIASFTPWRTDGRNFRSVNPWSGRWGDVWSSDFSRAGWIPGDDVDPYVFDVSQYLTPGRHFIDYQIVGIQPDGDSGYGYWRTSSYLTGFAKPDNADFNADGAVDGQDLLVWQRGQGLTGQTDNTRGDANGDGVIDAADLAAWTEDFGDAVPSEVVPFAVPEPAAGALAVASAVGCTVIRRRTSAMRCRRSCKHLKGGPWSSDQRQLPVPAAVRPGFGQVR